MTTERLPALVTPNENRVATASGPLVDDEGHYFNGTDPVDVTVTASDPAATNGQALSGVKTIRMMRVRWSAALAAIVALVAGCGSEQSAQIATFGSAAKTAQGDCDAELVYTVHVRPNAAPGTAERSTMIACGKAADALLVVVDEYPSPAKASAAVQHRKASDFLCTVDRFVTRSFLAPAYAPNSARSISSQASMARNSCDLVDGRYIAATRPIG